MKKVKFMLAILMLSVATLAFSHPEAMQSRFSISIPLKVALTNPDLVKAMNQQLDPGFLGQPVRPQIIFQRVVFH